MGAGFELLGLGDTSFAVALEPGEEFTLPDSLEVQITVVVLASGNIFWVLAVASAISVSDFEDSADGAAILARYSFQADVVFPAVFWVGVTAEGASIRNLTRRGAGETVRYFLVFAFGHLVSPHAHTGFPVVSEPRAALVAGSLSVPAVPENVTFSFIREDAVQPRTVRS